MRGYVRLASMPMPARLEHYNLLERLGAARIFCEDFLASIDPGEPLARLTDTYSRANAHSLINRMLALDLKYTLADNDLRKVTRTCDLAGIGRAPLHGHCPGVSPGRVRQGPSPGARNGCAEHGLDAAVVGAPEVQGSPRRGLGALGREAHQVRDHLLHRFARL